jgi:hypothetical protein
MFIKRIATAATLIVCGATSTSASSAPNPFAGLLASANARGQSEQVIDAPRGPDRQLDEIVAAYANTSQYADAASPACVELNRRGGRIFATSSGYLSTGQAAMASASYLLDAELIAACAIVPGDAGVFQTFKIPRVPLAQAYGLVGHALGMSALASYKANRMVGPGIGTRAKQALALLSFDEKAHFDLIRTLKQVNWNN